MTDCPIPTTAEIHVGDCREVLRTLPDKSVNCCVTSPPYFGLRNYNVAGQCGLEPTPEEFVANLVGVFRDVRRVLRDDATLWLNLGDSYAQNETRHRQGASGSTLRDGNCSPAEAWASGTAQTGRKLAHGLKSKDLIGIPWRVAFALQADGWYLRQDIIWAKPAPMPESVKDRCTRAHEYLFLLAKSPRYYFDSAAMQEPASENPVTASRRTRTDNSAVGRKDLHGTPEGQSGKGVGRVNGGACFGSQRVEATEAGVGARTYERPVYLTRNKRSVWLVASAPFKGAHFATFPEKLIEPCILAGCPEGGVVLDPFAGAGTTGLVAKKHGRNFVGIELNPAYADMARKRITGENK